MEPLPRTGGGHHVELNDWMPDIVEALAEADGVDRTKIKRECSKCGGSFQAIRVSTTAV